MLNPGIYFLNPLDVKILLLGVGGCPYSLPPPYEKLFYLKLHVEDYGDSVISRELKHAKNL